MNTNSINATLEQQQAVTRLKQGLKHHDYFGAKPDDSPVMIVPDKHSGNVLYELPYDGGRLTLGDLRDILSMFEEVQ